jgi:hypothetical protein
MILSRGMTPAQAADQVLRLLPFAGDAEVEGGAIAPAGFRLVTPDDGPGPHGASGEMAYA